MDDVTGRAGREAEERPPPLPASAIAPAVIVFCLVIPLIEVTRSIVATPYAPMFFQTAVAAALVVPLTIHLVRHAMRGTIAPYGRTAVAAVFAVSLVAAAVIGEGWSMMLVFPAVCGLLTLRWPAAVVGFVAMESTVLAIGTGAANEGGWTPVYYTFSVGYRVTALLALIATVMVHRQLLAAREQLRDAAVMRERLRIDDEVQRVVAPLLARLTTDPPDSEEELAELVAEARATLAATRRIIVGYQRQSIARELDTAAALLEVGGTPTAVVAGEVDLDRPASADFRGALRAAVIEGLATEDGEPVELVVVNADEVELRPRGTHPAVGGPRG